MKGNLVEPVWRSCIAKRDYLSWSAVRTYRTCPLKYYFHYVAALPEEGPSSSLVFGGAMHRALEHYFTRLARGELPPGQTELLSIYEEHWASYSSQEIRFGLREARPSLKLLAIGLLERFLASDVAHPDGNIVAVETELRGSISSALPDFLGIVDLIVETPEALVIYDWKTSRTRWTEDQAEEGFDQLRAYGLLASDLRRNKPLRLEILVMTKTKLLEMQRFRMDVQNRELERTRRRLELIWRAIRGEHFYPAPSPLACASCAYRQPCRDWPHAGESALAKDGG